MTRFVLLSTQRSGSTWVVDTLNSHPRVVAYSELFMHGSEGRPKWGGERGLVYWRTFLEEKGSPRSRLVRAYWLWRYLGRAYASQPGVDAAGFKLMYSQLRVSRPLLPVLVLRRVRIIHLIRRNALDILLSKEAGAARGGTLHARSTDAVQTVQLRLPTEGLLERIASHEREVARARARFSRLGLAYREVAYEDLVRDEEREFASLFGFLRVGPANGAVSSSLRKVNPTSHEELIENYDEVRTALEGTRFAPHLR